MTDPRQAQAAILEIMAREAEGHAPITWPRPLERIDALRAGALALRSPVDQVDEVRLERLMHWQRGAQEASTGQPCETWQSDAYKEGWSWFHDNPVACIMAQRIGAIAEKAAKLEKQAALRVSGSPALIEQTTTEEKDSGAGLIGQPIPTVDETEPRPDEKAPLVHHHGWYEGPVEGCTLCGQTPDPSPIRETSGRTPEWRENAFGGQPWPGGTCEVCGVVTESKTQLRCRIHRQECRE